MRKGIAMRKGFIAVLLVLALAATAYGGLLHFGGGKVPAQINQVSEVLTASGQAYLGKCAFRSVNVVTDGTNAVTLNVYDATSATGKKLIPTNTYIAGTSRTWSWEYGTGIEVSTGVYVQISVAGGGSCSVIVAYDAG